MVVGLFGTHFNPHSTFLNSFLFIESKQLVDETSIENLYKTKPTLKEGLLYNKLIEVVKHFISPNLMPVHSFPAFCDVSNLFTCLTFTIKVDSVKPKFKQAIKYLNTNLKLISFV